jgi:hypothetical protein
MFKLNSVFPSYFSYFHLVQMVAFERESRNNFSNCIILMFVYRHGVLLKVKVSLSSGWPRLSIRVETI